MSVALVRAALDVAGLTAPFLEAEAVSAEGVAPAVVWSVAVEGASLGAAVAEEAGELCVDRRSRVSLVLKTEY